MRDIPKVVVTVAKNLDKAVLLAGLMNVSWQVPDIAVIKQATHIKRVETEKMLANCLGKAGATQLVYLPG